MAFLQSSPPRQPLFRAPSIVTWLIGILVLLHAARAFAPEKAAIGAVYEYGLVPARYSRAFLASHMADPGTVWERLLPFITYMGLHNDWTHLAVNCLWLLAFGPIVARRFGAPLFLLFFILCGVAGGMTYVGFNWASPIPVVGASGAISGLMGAGLRLLPGQAPPWVRAGRDAPLLPLFSRQILVFTALWAAINLLAGLTGLGMGGERGLVAWQAHLGGYLAGLLLSGPFDLLKPRTVGLPLDD